jgi:hypothetical protein
MRYREISPPKTHPHVICISIDPVRFARLRQVVDEAPELRFIGYDPSQPDAWAVRIGCASEAVASAMKDGWG